MKKTVTVYYPHHNQKGDKKETKGFLILNQSKLLTRLPILFAQVKPGNNSNKLKSEIKRIIYILYYIRKSQKDFTAN